MKEIKFFLKEKEIAIAFELNGKFYCSSIPISDFKDENKREAFIDKSLVSIKYYNNEL